MNNYLQRLAKDLVANQGFQLLSEQPEAIEAPDSNPGWPGSGVLLGRKHWGKIQFVRLLGADRLPLEMIAALNSQDNQNFEDYQHETKSNGISAITLLIFSKGVPQGAADSLLSLQSKSLWYNRSNLIWLLDLEANTVIGHRGRTPKTFLTSEYLLSLGKAAGSGQWVEESSAESQDSHSQAPQSEVMQEAQGARRRKFGEGSTPWITIAILAINVVIWALMELAGGSQDAGVLLAFGAKVNSLILAGEYWRLITPVFLHIGLEHLLFNSFALYQLGSGGEYLFGRTKFIAIYLISGLWGGAASFAFSDYLSAGASGAIFGIFGSYLYFGLRERAIFSQGLGGGIIAALLINLAYGFFNQGVDNYAHLGGLVGGFLMSCALGLRGDRVWQLSRLMWLMGTVVSLGLLLKMGFILNIRL
ncbi:MAG TPA: rhomboid family intramembrane serine protease [Bacillota bacterium]|nr:rhomboid family intramembrane serine protease [Bacillota bacterium]